MRINIGSLETRIPGFKNVDVVPGPFVDIVADARKLPFEDCSVEDIYASHVLEHFGRTESEDVLKEWFRVLESGGHLYVAVPDWDAIVFHYVKTGLLSEWLVELLYGQQHNEFYNHRTVFNQTRLIDMLKKVGFDDVERVKLLGLVEKDCSTLVTEVGGEKFLTSLNIIATKG